MSRFNLPVLDVIIKRCLSSEEPFPFFNTTVVYVHHALASSLSLLEAIFQLGLSPNNTFVLNKHYSECESVVQAIKKLGVNYQPCSEQIGLGRYSQTFTYDIMLLWNKVLSANQETEKIIVLDHGGYALNYIPAQILNRYKVVGIEKTAAGVLNFNLDTSLFPIIEIATCAAKKLLESPLIAEAVVEKLMPLVPIKQKNIVCGVIGQGAIGKAIAKELASIGNTVIVYDKDPSQLKENTKEIIATDDLTAAIVFADYVFGCTGQDITALLDVFRFCPKDKVLISCSSEDREFLSLIRYIQRKIFSGVRINPLKDILWRNDAGAEVRIVRGGFPVNFDGSDESVPHKDIQLTRALVLAGALQAVGFFENRDRLKQNETYMLDPAWQKFVVNEWFKVQSFNRFDQETIRNFQDEKWIVEHSGGKFFESLL